MCILDQAHPERPPQQPQLMPRDKVLRIIVESFDLLFSWLLIDTMLKINVVIGTQELAVATILEE